MYSTVSYPCETIDMDYNTPSDLIPGDIVIEITTDEANPISQNRDVLKNSGSNFTTIADEATVLFYISKENSEEKELINVVYYEFKISGVYNVTIVFTLENGTESVGSSQIVPEVC